MNQTIYYYTSPTNHNPVKDFLDSLPSKDQAKILRIFTYLEQNGPLSSLPHIKKLTSTPFWEIRVLGKSNLRVIYAIVLKNKILVLHGFIKKSNKTPQKDLRTALNRYREWLDR